MLRRRSIDLDVDVKLIDFAIVESRCIVLPAKLISAVFLISFRQSPYDCSGVVRCNLIMAKSFVTTKLYTAGAIPSKII